MELTVGELRWPWALAAVAALALLLMLWWARWPRPRDRGDAVLLAHLGRLRALPRYRALLRRQRLAGLASTLAALVVVAGAAAVLARPQVLETAPREARNRDIMLCLDASTSMADDNAEILRAVRSIVDGLEGDRIGLTIWSAASVLVFPLTDDYDHVRERLDRAEQALAGRSGGFFAGVNVLGRGSSLIGDGIVSCVDRFDRPLAERTRAVLVASDNDVAGTPVYGLPEAAEYAAERDVLVYGVGAAALSDPAWADQRAELAAAAEATGGTLALIGEDGGTERIVDRIDALERARASEPPRRILRDDPRLGTVASAVGVGLLALCWIGSWAPGRRRRRGAS